MNNFTELLKNSLLLSFDRFIIISFLLIFISFGTGWSATYYVKTGGNDNFDGLSDATAWATIAKVQSKVTSGDTVYFRSQDTWTSSTLPVLKATAGVTYDGSSYGSGTRAKITTSYAGSPGYRTYCVVQIEVSDVTFKGFDVNVNSARIDGIDVGTMAISDINNTTVENCEVHNNSGISGDWNYGILVSNKFGHTIFNTTINECIVHDVFHEGIAIYASWNNRNNRNDTVLIRNCTIYNTGKIGSGGVGVLLCNDSRNVIVEFCNLYNNNFGIWIRNSPMNEGYVDFAPQNMSIRYNIIRNNNINGISIVNPRNLILTGSFYNNLFYSNGKKGYIDTADFFIADSSNSSDYTDGIINIYNNTFYFTDTYGSNSASSIAFGYFGKINHGSFALKNNIIYSGNYKAVVNKAGKLLDHSNNLIYRSSGSSDATILDDVTSYNRAAVTHWESTAQNSAPNFIGGTLPTGFTGIYGKNMVPNTNYFAISSGSALGNGDILGSPYNGCINGAGLATPIIRPPGEAYDIGAYESTIPAPELLKVE